MSFDIFLVAFRDGERINADVDAARSVLNCYQFKHTPELGAYIINFSDDSSLEMYCESLHDNDRSFSGGMVALRGLTKSVSTFIYDFSRAAGCVILPAMEPPILILPKGDLAVRVPKGISENRKIIPVSNGLELLAVLRGGYEGWQAYRDQVMKSQGDSNP